MLSKFCAAAVEVKARLMQPTRGLSNIMLDPNNYTTPELQRTF